MIANISSFKDITFYFGLDKVPLIIEQSIFTENRLFFTVISKGLMPHLSLTPAKWAKIAPELDEIIVGRKSIKDDGLLAACHELGVMTVLDTISIIRQYLQLNLQALVEKICKKKSLNITSVKVLFIKEGCTSSVWKVSLTVSGESSAMYFVLNVGRDRIANEDLWVTSTVMENIQRLIPEAPLAYVYSKQRLKIEEIAYDVVITANKWIEDGEELSLVKNMDSEKQFLFAIHEFVIDKNTGRVNQFKGRSLSEQESTSVWKKIRKLQSCLTNLVSEQKLAELPRFEINEGDVLWTGKEIAFVGFSSPHPMIY